MIQRITVFLLLNFGTLGLGQWLMGEGPSSTWYQTLVRAPWTPPGWVFGAAWTTIMICFSVYMAKLWQRAVHKKGVAVLFGLQLILNVMWNPTFFRWHATYAALGILIALTSVVAVLLVGYRRTTGWFSMCLVPYLAWLMIATSLNAFITQNNV